MPSVLGLDLGGTKIAGARFDIPSRNNVQQARRETGSGKGFHHVIDLMLEIIEELRADDTEAIGIGVPGLVSQPDCTVLNMPNIEGGKNVDIRKILGEKIDVPIFVDNDANCFALAEALEGAGKGHDVIVGITMGTGVGGGIILDGKIFHGATGYAGEFGHMLLMPGQPPYVTDDKRGDVEQFLSGTAMGRRCREADSPEQYLQGDTCAFMHPDILKEIAWMATNIIHTINPSVLIFGGSAGRALAPHLKGMEEALKKWTLPGTPLPALKIAELTDAGTRGAALMCDAHV